MRDISIPGKHFPGLPGLHGMKPTSPQIHLLTTQSTRLTGAVNMSIMIENQATGNTEQKKSSTENASINANGEHKNAAFEALEKAQAIQAANESAEPPEYTPTEDDVGTIGDEPPEDANLNLPEEHDKPSAPNGAWIFNQGKSCLKWNWDGKDCQGKHLPPGFYQYEQIEAATEEKPARYGWKYICSPWRVLGVGRDSEGDEWYFVEVKDPDKGLTYEARLLAGFWEEQGGWRAVVSKGVRFAPGFTSKDKRHRLLEAMRMSNNSNIFDKRDIIIPTQTGWQPGGYRAYIFPDGEVIGENADRYRVPAKIKRKTIFGVAGTLDSWKQNVAPLLNCPMGHLMICAGFAAPFVQTRDNLAGVLIYGDSNAGKTLIASAYVSIYGDASEAGNCALMKSRATANAIEWTAAQSRNSVLVIDEMAQLQKQFLEGVAYMLANGKTKQRLQNKGQGTEQEEQKEVNVFTVLTAERSMMNLAALRGVPWDTGSDRRLPSVQFINELPTGWLPGEWKMKLSQAITENYGAVGRKWLGEMMKKLQANPGYIRQIKQDEFSRWQTRFPGVKEQALKVMQAFSLLCALGCAAYPYHGIDEDDIRASMFRIFDGIRENFGSGNRNVACATAYFIEAVQTAGANGRFNNGAVSNIACDGWVTRVDDGHDEYQILAHVFNTTDGYRWDGNGPEQIFDWLEESGIAIRNVKQKNRRLWIRHGVSVYRFVVERQPED